jgi:[ribosomal protein S5]-alanine N-acetyltransferase
LEVLRTERLVLRPFVVDDLDALAQILDDPEVMRYVGKGEARGRTRDESERTLRTILEEYERWGHGLLAVTTPADDGDRLIGWCGLLRWNLTGVEEIEVAYLLGRPYWGQGYATEAAMAVRDDALGLRGRKRLVSLIYPDNHASVRVAEKVGMAYERDVEYFGHRLLLYSLGPAVDPVDPAEPVGGPTGTG